MRVAIVAAFFDADLDYVETTAARVLAADHDVYVITTVRRSQTLSDVTANSLDPFPAGTTTADGVTLLRLVPWMSLGQRVMANGVREALAEVHPDVVIQVVPAQLFSIPASRYARDRGIPLIYISGENSQQGPQRGIGLLLKKVYLKSIWRLIARHTAGGAAKAIVTTEETARLLKESGVSASTLMALPYRSDKYYLSQAARDSTRSSLGIEGGFVTLFVGRFVPGKRIERIVDAWTHAAAADPHAHLLLVGSTEDDYSKQVRAVVAESPLSARITVLPFCGSNQVNAYLNAADVGVWPTVSVGIQQAMATGLFVLVPSGSPGEFLVQGDAQALGSTYFETDVADQSGSLATAITAAGSKADDEHRRIRADRAARLYSDTFLGHRLLSGLSRE